VISETQVEADVTWLLTSAHDIAQARADMIVLEQGLKRIKAVAMAEHKALPISAQEREAYAAPSYEAALAGLREAIYRYEKLRAERDARSARIEAWRSIEATRRSVRL
jgi:hypothetical protein